MLENDIKILETAREAAKLLQNDERVVALCKAKADNDLDTELQEQIGEFNTKRLDIEMAHRRGDAPEKIEELTKEMQILYNTVMENENMQAYSAAKAEVDEMLQHIDAIYSMAAMGEDMDKFDVETLLVGGCGGGCSSCSGCH